MTLEPAVRRFLEGTSPPLLASVATVRADGRPHVVPVWYGLEGDALDVWTTDERAWVRNLQRDPRVAVSVHEAEAPFRAVILSGSAEVVTADSEDVMRRIERITERYVAADAVADYVAGWPSLRTIVTIRLADVRARV
jgi:PPOX class probable F420-dependent enzyme